MEDYDAATYGERVAGVYDEITEGRFDVAATVDLLAELVGDGRALELAIGTGRLALPLAGRGVPVDGIDVSVAMIARLRAKPGGDAIQVTMGNFADVGVEARYRLIFLAFNTFFALLSQEEQIRCFTNVAEHLDGHGMFLLEAFVPDLARFDRGQRISALDVGADRVRLDVSCHDAFNQRVDSSHIVLTEEGVKLYPVSLRYAWPTELDLMARLAGLQLRHRWAGWHKEAFGSDSSTHVSVYGK
jgi:hypothetical protein